MSYFLSYKKINEDLSLFAQLNLTGIYVQIHLVLLNAMMSYYLKSYPITERKVLFFT